MRVEERGVKGNDEESGCIAKKTRRRRAVNEIRGAGRQGVWRLAGHGMTYDFGSEHFGRDRRSLFAGCALLLIILTEQQSCCRWLYHGAYSSLLLVFLVAFRLLLLCNFAIGLFFRWRDKTQCVRG